MNEREENKETLNSNVKGSKTNLDYPWALCWVVFTESGNSDKSKDVSGGLKGKSTSRKYPWQVRPHHSKTEMSKYLI